MADLPDRLGDSAKKPKPIFLPRNQIFKRGPLGSYAVRYRSSPESPHKKFALRRLREYAGSSDCPEDHVDSLSHHASRLIGCALRSWTVVQQKSKQSRSFRLCSYNVLCQSTIEVTSFLYTRNNKKFLDWSHRSNRFRRELPALDADVFCLQEVHHAHYKNFFLPLFMKCGFEGRYEQKNGTMDDGCALFFRTSVFREVDYRRVEMFLAEESTLDKPNVGQLIRLKDLTTKREICVANTHLVFNTKSGARKFAQLALLIAHLSGFVEKGGRKADYVLCGDLNIEAFSDIYRFVIEKRLNVRECEEILMSGQGVAASQRGRRGPPRMKIPREAALHQDCTLVKEGEDVFYEDHSWSHRLNFASAYNHIRTNGTHDLSTFTSKEGLNPDFMFYSVESTQIQANGTVLQVQEAGLRLLNRLELPDISEANAAFGPWPNQFTPSDHVPLLVDFAFV